MRRFLPVVAAVAALCAALPVAAATYGQPMPAGDARPIATVMADAAANAGEPVKVQGRIAQVCQKTGCWLMLDNRGQGVRVRTKHAFFVPKDASGTATVHGRLEPVEVTPEQAAHYAEDGVAPEGAREWQIVATSIAILPAAPQGPR